MFYSIRRDVSNHKKDMNSADILVLQIDVKWHLFCLAYYMDDNHTIFLQIKKLQEVMKCLSRFSEK